jgi:peptidoglycan/LPS O-acetylase OafA/YrhL
VRPPANASIAHTSLFEEIALIAAGSVSHKTCLPDIPGGPVAAGVTLFASIILTGLITVGLTFYIIRNKPLALPGPSGSTTTQGGDGGTPQDVSGSGKLQKKRVHMHTLDGMRVLLVTAVVFAHYPIGLPTIVWHFLGWPMQFFFVLSGFVAQVQQDAGSEYFDWFGGLTYVARRLARILPLYQLALVFQFGVAIISNMQCHPVIAWPFNALLLQAVFPVRVCGEPDWGWTANYTHFNGNGPAWFAACIVWFSCLFPLLYNFRPRSQSQGLLPMALLTAILICRAVPDWVNPQWGNFNGETFGPHLYAMTPIRLMEFLAGMWAAQAASEMSHRLSAWGFWCWMFDLSLLLLIAMIYFSIQYLGSTWTCSGDYHITIFSCLVCFTARLAAEMPEEKRLGLQGGILHRCIGSPVVTYLAPYSFAAYIFQTTFMGWTEGGQDFHLFRFCLLWAFAIFATTYIEEPIRIAAESRLKAK